MTMNDYIYGACKRLRSWGKSKSMLDLGQILFLREQILRNGRVEIWWGFCWFGVLEDHISVVKGLQSLDSSVAECSPEGLVCHRLSAHDCVLEASQTRSSASAVFAISIDSVFSSHIILMPHPWFFLTCLFGLLFDNCISILANTRCFRLERQREFFLFWDFFWGMAMVERWLSIARLLSSCFIDIICLSELGIFMTVDVVSDFCVLVWDQLRMEHWTCAQLSSMLEHGCGCAFLQLAWKRFSITNFCWSLMKCLRWYREIIELTLVSVIVREWLPCWWLLHGFRLLIGELSCCFNETNYLGSSGKLWDAPNVTFHRHIIISCSCSFLHGNDNEGFQPLCSWPPMVLMPDHGLKIAAGNVLESAWFGHLYCWYTLL